MFSHESTGVMDLGEAHRRDEVPCSSHLIQGTRYQCDFFLVMLSLITWVRWCLSLSSAITYFPPLSILYLLEASH